MRRQVWPAHRRTGMLSAPGRITRPAEDRTPQPERAHGRRNTDVRGRAREAAGAARQADEAAERRRLGAGRRRPGRPDPGVAQARQPAAAHPVIPDPSGNSLVVPALLMGLTEERRDGNFIAVSVPPSLLRPFSAVSEFARCMGGFDTGRTAVAAGRGNEAGGPRVGAARPFLHCARLAVRASAAAGPPRAGGGG